MTDSARACVECTEGYMPRKREHVSHRSTERETSMEDGDSESRVTRATEEMKKAREDGHTSRNK